MKTKALICVYPCSSVAQNGFLGILGAACDSANATVRRSGWMLAGCAISEAEERFLSKAQV
jgi:hypothetical protein